MNDTEYTKFLKKAPAHDSPEFIDFLRDNNEVVYENSYWIAIINCKYNKKNRSWITVFAKNVRWFETASLNSLGNLLKIHHNLEWLKKSTERQTVRRFHFHLYQVRPKKSNLLDKKYSLTIKKTKK